MIDDLLKLSLDTIFEHVSKIAIIAKAVFEKYSTSECKKYIVKEKIKDVLKSIDPDLQEWKAISIIEYINQ